MESMFSSILSLLISVACDTEATQGLTQAGLLLRSHTHARTHHLISAFVVPVGTGVLHLWASILAPATQLFVEEKTREFRSP